MSAPVPSISSLRARGLTGGKKDKGRHGRRPVTPSASLAERNRLLLDLLPQVRYIARRIHDRLPAHVSFEDVYHTGVLGLLDALKKFDPRKKVRIQSYMKFRIRGAILDGLRELDWSPRELRKKARQIELAEHGLRCRLGRNPVESEISAEMGVSLLQLQHLVGELRGLDLSSLQDIVATSEEGAGQELGGRLAGPCEEDPYLQCVKTEGKDRLARAIERLPEKERQVLALYYFEELTMKEIGGLLSVGESRVSQIHTLAMVRLRSLLGQQAAKAGGEPAAPDLFPTESRNSWPGGSKSKVKGQPWGIPA